MNEKEIRNRVIECIMETKSQIERVEMEDSIIFDYEFDSIELVSLVILIEEKIGISFSEPYDLVENINTVGSLVDYLYTIEKRML